MLREKQYLKFSYLLCGQRLDNELAATAMQLYLWAPSSWLKSEGRLPSSNEVNAIIDEYNYYKVDENDLIQKFSYAQVLQWLLCLTTKVLCDGRNVKLSPSYRSSVHVKSVPDSSRDNVYKSTSYGRRTMPEYQLIASFLSRVTLVNVRNALKWIQRNI